MNYNGPLDIALGGSRRTKNWKNKKFQWSELVGRLAKEIRTKETYKEYMSSTKADQSDIKDVGGYVGGYLRQGRRTPKNVVHRQLVTLDIDFAHIGFWEDYEIMFDNAAVLHSTHKHHENNPRFRLILPLSREATAEEYVAVARRIAGDLGIELFDNTTFEPSRLMYWPSTPTDIEYYFRFQDGPWIDVDATLARYADWTDTSLWPTSQAQADRVKNTLKKQQDPQTKTGLIGAFCRAYTITEALDAFLEDEYARVDDTRYTYKLGSTAGGLILYDDNFSFSHHGTDPSSGKLCNSFDLVRIHKFGHLDEGAKEGGQSFKAMQEFILEDKKVKKLIAKEKIDSAKYDFEEDVTLSEDELAWMSELEANSKGAYLSSASNLNLIFANDARLAGAFRENKFDGKRYVYRNLPWRRVGGPEIMRNVDHSGIRNYIETVYGITGNLKIDDCLNLAADKIGFHPIKDYLMGLKWDGVKRVDTLLIEYLGAEDNIYTREAIRKMLVAAAARIFRPGTKYDLVLTLVGAEGTGKSTFAHKLGGQWFSDTFMTVHGKEAFEQIQGAWIIEMAELSGLRKAEVEAIKHFITKQVDAFRPAYARVSETYPRQCVFIGTTNSKDFLRGTTGNRRFIPVDVNEEAMTKDVFTDLVGEEIDQIWAEACHLYRKGEPLFMSKEAAEIAKLEQSNHSEFDMRTGIIEDYLATLLPEDWDNKNLIERKIFLEDDELAPDGTVQRMYVCTPEIWCECFGRPKKDMDRFRVREINDILRTLPGWKLSRSKKTFPIYGRQRYYEREDS